MTYANRSPLTAHKITGIAQIKLAVQLTQLVGQDSDVQHRVATARPVSLTAHR